MAEDWQIKELVESGDLLREADKEIARLKQSLAAINDQDNFNHRLLEAARKDAERYRKLKALLAVTPGDFDEFVDSLTLGSPVIIQQGEMRDEDAKNKS